MPTPAPSNPGRSDPSRARRTALILGCGFVLIVAVPLGLVLVSEPVPIARRPKPDGPTRAAYIGSRACADCHPDEFAAHSRSGHARTLRPAARTRQAGQLDNRTFPDPERPGSRWSYYLGDGRLLAERREGEEVERYVLDYAFGSGHHATTFVTMTDRTPEHPTMIEHRLTVYAHKEAPDVTPGQGLARGPHVNGVGPFGRRHEARVTVKCFDCHVTLTSDRGPQLLDESTMIPNVGCERCHGPGRTHVEAARRGAEGAVAAMPFGPGRATALEEMRLCGACHRLPEMGDAGVIRPDNPGLVRFQPIGLMQSACYRKSPGALTCSTCHDPHARTSTDLAEYEAICLSCHRGTSQVGCKIDPAAGCIGCHMPRRDATRGMMMTDHWIRSRPEIAATPPVAPSDPSAPDASGIAPH